MMASIQLGVDARKRLQLCCTELIDLQTQQGVSDEAGHF
jgi:hypothetical protein